MKSYTLKNGLKIVLHSKKSNSVVIEVSINVGSNYEEQEQRGISHVIEHMLFEGTLNRTQNQIANEIEKLGGEINAATSHDRTYFYIKIPKKHFEIGLDVLADMIKNPLFDEKIIEKEKKVVIDEINLVLDEPRFYRWVLFLKKLYKKHPIKNPIYGFKESVKAMTKADLIKFYEKYYIPNNIVVSVVGGVSSIANVKKAFGDLKRGRKVRIEKISEPRQRTAQKIVEKRKTMQSYVVIGYKTVERVKKESYVLDVIAAILGRGQSGKLFNEIRTKRGLAYDVGVYHETSKNYGFFGVYVDTNKKNIMTVKKIVSDELEKLKNVSDRDLKEAKTFIEGKFVLNEEDNRKFADFICFWENVGNVSYLNSYIKNINNVRKSDVSRVVKKYLGKNYVLAVIEQK